MPELSIPSLKCKNSLTVITDLIKRDMLYEDKRHNCVFVGYNWKHTPRYSSLREIYGNFKGEISGSGKCYSVLLPLVNPDCQLAVVFESPIDALSHKTLYPEYACWGLSLGDIALTALV